MKNTYIVISLIMLSILGWGCADEDGENPKTNRPYAVFMQENLSIPASAGDVITLIGWSLTDWEILMDTDNGVVSELSMTKGGNSKEQEKHDKIKIYYTENASDLPRTQEVFLVNKSTGERSKLTIEQKTKYAQIPITLNNSIKYQHVVGFGGMYNPKIWTPSNLITDHEIKNMYAPDALGYNILRLMIYPKESDWAADVVGAKLAQQYGAIIFASPWDCTDQLSENIKVNNKEVKHLKKENYQAYADHLVKYINYMKSNGINLYAISVQNEPDMDFTFWYPQEVVDFVKTFGDQIRATGVKLMAPEGCGMQPEYTDPILNDAEAFSRTDILAGHLYQGFIDSGSSYVKNRHDYISNLYNKKLSAVGKTWWMTEHLFNDGDKETDPSLWKFQQWSYNLDHLAKEIHMSMDGYCSAYIYWYLKRFYGMIGDNDEKSPVKVGEVAKNGYILSHYAKYASNMFRIKVETGDPDILTTAYVNNANTEMTVVVLNMKSKIVNVQVTSPIGVTSVDAKETTEDKNMEVVSSSLLNENKTVSLLLSARSITSVKLKLQ